MPQNNNTPAQWPLGFKANGDTEPAMTTTYRLPGGIALQRALSPQEIRAAMFNPPMAGGNAGIVDAYGNVWQGPGAPAVPQAPAGEPVRRFDYEAFWNVWKQPENAKALDGGIDFSILREFSKQTLVRLAIETVKDLDEATNYGFQLEAVPGERAGQTRKRTMSDPRIAEVTKFFKKPDGIHDFAQWRRLAWEEVLVADNLTVYRRDYEFGPKRGPARLAIIDGDTIEPMIDPAGYTPEGDDVVAFEQWIKGSPRTPFTQKELFYAIFNPRVKHIYGHSPVEQILWYINILIRRDARKSAEYTDGNIPAALWSAPDTWTPTQIREAQLWFDAYLTGDPAARSKLIFVPGGARPPVFPGERQLNDPFDDLLIRLVCFAFNISPSTLLRQVMRATAEQNKDQADEEGLGVRRRKMAAFLTRIVEWAFGYDDIVCVPHATQEVDPQKQAEIDKTYVTIGVRQINEIREDRGEEPIPELNGVYGLVGQNGFVPFGTSIRAAEAGATAAENGASGMMREPDGDEPPSGGAPNGGAPKPAGKKPMSAEATKVAADVNRIVDTMREIGIISAGEHQWRVIPEGVGKRIARRVTLRQPDLLDKYQTGLKDKIALFFKAQAEQIANKVRGQYEFLRKDDASLVGTVAIDWSQLVDLIEPTLEKIYMDAAQQAADDLGIDLSNDAFDQLNEQASLWAHERAAELVGKSWVDGQLIDNPNARWSITNTTRNAINKAVSNAIDNGLSPQQLADAINQLIDDEPRADMIARTELAFAQSAGAQAEWDASGVVSGKEWLLSNDHPEMDECDDNADDGVIAYDESFSSGDDMPPAHPRCECDVAAAVDEQALAAAIQRGDLRKRFSAYDLDDDHPAVIAARGNAVAKFNPYHDARGRFDFGPQGELASRIHSEGGFTVHTKSKAAPKDGWMVSLEHYEKAIPKNEFSADNIREYMREHGRVLSKPNNYLGAWFNKEDGKVYLDVSTRFRSRSKALTAGRRRHQFGIFNIGTKEYVPTNAHKADSGDVHTQKPKWHFVIVDKNDPEAAYNAIKDMIEKAEKE